MTPKLIGAKRKEGISLYGVKSKPPSEMRQTASGRDHSDKKKPASAGFKLHQCCQLDKHVIDQKKT
ncbi:MAG TPA: hypothetical protein VFJ73_01880 [Bacillales bacterium]|nr:hypothetical protein [Bacillales bacterium]